MAQITGALAASLEEPNPETVAAIDRGHLERMTLGDRSLAHEVLQLFDRQAALLIERMRKAEGLGDSSTVVALAHTMKGSAAGIGAGPVARAAAATERAAADAPRDVAVAIDALARAVDEARVLIDRLLREG